MKTSDRKKELAHILAVFAKRLAVIFGIAVLFTALHIYIPRNVSYEYTEPEKSTASPRIIPEVPNDSLCTLRLEDGRLGIYKSNGELESVVEMDPELLTDYDRALLSEGICASRQELSELIGELLS